MASYTFRLFRHPESDATAAVLVEELAIEASDDEDAAAQGANMTPPARADWAYVVVADENDSIIFHRERP